MMTFPKLLLLLLFLSLSGCATNPVTGEKQFNLMSEDKEMAMGDSYYPVYTQVSNGLFQDKNLQLYVNQTGKKCAAKSHRPQLNYEFNVVNTSVINAYALPGGKISITRGLLNLMENEDQLAGVLSHEVGHVAARHVASGYTRSVLTGFGLSLLDTVMAIKDVKNREYYNTAAGLAANLIVMKYSRDQEREADTLGMEYMVKAGYNPVGFVQTMQILQSLSQREPSKLEIMFQSHPMSLERIENAKAQIQSNFATLQSNTFQVDEFQKNTNYLKKVGHAYKQCDQSEELTKKEKFGEAVMELKSALTIAPDEALIHTTLSAAYFAEKKYEEAANEIERSLSMYPDLFMSRFLAGLILHTTNKFETSITHLKIADKLVPDNVNVVFYLGLNYEKLKEIETAAEYYKRLLQLTTKGEKAEYAYKRLCEWGFVRGK
ncbi:M48 family metalloprotease [Candidatus Desantisbacteria bacterium]|nr:M48 family metalloprotease [Candidatus Desantisbacteria bacterium]